MMKSEKKLYEKYKEFIPEYELYRKKRGPLEFGPWLAVFNKVSEDTSKDNDLLDELFCITKAEGDEEIISSNEELKWPGYTHRQFLYSDASAAESSRAPLAPCEYLSLEEQGYHHDEQGRLIDKDGDECFPDDGSKIKGFKETVKMLAPIFGNAIR